MIECVVTRMLQDMLVAQSCMVEVCSAQYDQVTQGAACHDLFCSHCHAQSDTEVSAPAGVYKVSGSLKGAATALLRLLVNGAQVQRTPELTVVPGAPATIAWVNASLLTAGLNVTAGEEGFAELMCQDAYGNRVTNAAVGVEAHMRPEGGQVRASNASRTHAWSLV